MPLRVAVIAGGAGEGRAMRRHMHAGGPHLLAVDAPAGDAVRVSRTARVSMWVASEPCSGSVRPKVMRMLPVRQPSIIAFCSSAGRKRSNIGDRGKLPTIECSFCRSLCRPSPLAARCSRITAIQRLEPSLPPYRHGIGEAQMAGRCRRASCASAQQRLPFVPRQAAIVEIGARPFAAMVEEADIVVAPPRCGLISSAMKRSSSAR